MALKPPGSASKIALFFSSVWTIVMLLALIGGNLILAVFLFVYFDQGLGMEVLVERTGLPSALLWSAVVVSIVLDGWIFLSDRKKKENVRRR